MSGKNKTILRLENPGNGEDTFILSGFATAGNLSEALNVTFEITNPSRTIGLEGSVWFLFGQQYQMMPARETFQLIFDWSSTGDATISDQASITIEARPDQMGYFN